MVATVMRLRDVGASVRWYREKLGLAPIHVGADGPDHPFASFVIAGSVMSLWQLPAGEPAPVKDVDTTTYLAIVLSVDLEPVRRALVDRGITVSEIRRSAHNEFVWFEDPDGNRFELSRKSTSAG